MSEADSGRKNGIPQTVIWENETFQDGVDIQPDDFYKRLSMSRVMPTTSQVTVPAMEEVFKRLLDCCNDVLGIFVSSKFSGTLASAMMAREKLSQASEKIAIVDSLITIMAMG